MYVYIAASFAVGAVCANVTGLNDSQVSHVTQIVRNCRDDNFSQIFRNLVDV